MILDSSSPNPVGLIMSVPGVPGPPGDVSWSGAVAGRLPATSGQHLTTQGGNTLDDGAGGVVIKGGTLDGVTIGGTTASPSITATAMKSIAIKTLSGSTMKAWLDHEDTYIGSLTGGGGLNRVYCNNAVAGDTNWIWGIDVLHNALNPGVGLRGGIQGQVLVTSAGTNSRTQAQYVGVHGAGTINVGLGGTSMGPTGSPKGAVWGGWFQGVALAGTNLDEVIGVEINTTLASGVTVNTKNCLRIVDISSVSTRGVTDDHAVLIGVDQSSPATWLDGIFFGSNQANGTGSQGLAWPFDSTSTIINCAPAAASGPKAGNPAKTGIDFSLVTFTGPAIKLPAATVAFKEMSSDPAAITGYGQIYEKAGNLYHMSGGGNVTQLTTAG